MSKRPRIAIVGMGHIGASIGLALRGQEQSPEVVGYDAEQALARRALKMGALDTAVMRLRAACERASLVILALPTAAVREALQALGLSLSPGCVVTDTAALKLPVLAWAGELLPEHVHFVGGAPVPSPTAIGGAPPSGLDDARADLFKNSLWCLTPRPETDPDAVDIVDQLVQLLGARPLYMDAAEHDGLRAGVEGLPAIIATALLWAVVDTPGWSEMRKVAGYDFAAATGPAAQPAENQHIAATLNRENTLRRLDGFLAELHRLRDALAAGDGDTLKNAFAKAAADRAQWLQERQRGLWEQRKTDWAQIPTPSEQMERFIFGEGLLARLSRRSRTD